MPLEYFDDETFDDNSNDLWISRREDEEEKIEKEKEKEKDKQKNKEKDKL